MKIYDPKKILVPVDFSELSMGALRAGLEIGGKWDAEVLVLHISTFSDHMPSYAELEIAGVSPRSQRREDTRMELESRLDLLLKEISAGPKVRSTLLFGTPTADILNTAQSGNFDLIVMATHGRKGLSRLLLGSVTEQVVRRAPCPVFVVRSKVVEKKIAEAAAEERATAPLSAGAS